MEIHAKNSNMSDTHYFFPIAMDFEKIMSDQTTASKISNAKNLEKVQSIYNSRNTRG